MANQPVHHAWAPITDLSDADRAVASSGLPHLMRLWVRRRETLSPSQHEDFNNRLHREWAIETGIIERLYSIDEGTTQLLIEHGINAALIAHEDNGRPPEIIAGMILDHQDAVEWLFDIVRDERPLSTSVIKELHTLMTRKQTHVSGDDQFGRPVKIKLRHGAYKDLPNNPTRPDGAVHQYCPPEHVPAEMDRLIKYHENHHELEVSPDVSAAWLHHRFAQIHPFQDGNGRVARALASLVFIRANWFPLVVTRNDRTRYIEALGKADSGDLRALVGLFGSIQERWFSKSLSIVGDVEREHVSLDQMLDTIVESLKPATGEAGDRDRAKHHAEDLLGIAKTMFEEVRDKLEARVGADLRVFVDTGHDDTERRGWYHYQVVDTAKQLDYFANLRDYHAWVRLALQSPAGRSELLLSFHAVGRGQYHGAIGGSMCFYRKLQTGNRDIQQQLTDLQPVAGGLFQIAYTEDFEAAERRFRPWLAQALRAGLGLWLRGE